MTLATADFKIAGTITGTGTHASSSSTRPTTRWPRSGSRTRSVKMSAAEQAFELAGITSRPARSSSRTRTARRSSRQIKELRAAGVGDRRARRACRRTTSTCRASATSTPGRARRTKAGCGWRSTRCKIPYTYFGDNQLRQGNLRAKYDVIIYPERTGDRGRRRNSRRAARRSRTRRPTSRRTSARRPTRPTTGAAASAATA